MEEVNKTVNVLLSEIINPVVYFLSAGAFIWFLYGVFLFLWHKNRGEEAGIKTGKNHMLWGFLGLVIVYSASAIYEFITSFFN